MVLSAVFHFSLLPLQASHLTFKGLGRDIERSWQEFRSTQIQTGAKYQLESCLFPFSLHPLVLSFPKRKNICLYQVLALRCLQCMLRHTHTHTHTGSVSRAHYTVKTESGADVVFLKHRSRAWLLRSQSLTRIGFLY